MKATALLSKASEGKQKQRPAFQGRPEETLQTPLGEGHQGGSGQRQQRVFADSLGSCANSLTRHRVVAGGRG